MVRPIRHHDSTTTIDEESELSLIGHDALPVSADEGSRFIMSAIRRHAELRPDAPAVVTESAGLTYRQLYERAGELAVRLAAEATEVGDIIAVCLPRGGELIVAAVAAMLAGRAYLLIDVEQPRRRAVHMLKDSGARVVVTLEQFRERLSAVETTVLVADSLVEGATGSTVTDRNAAPPPAAVSELAYLCYTSGSTGLPKGVQVTHHGLANLVAWYTWQYGITPADRMTQLAAPAFDAWAMEVWPCLANGAALHVADAEVSRSPERLRDWLLDRRISVCFVPTPLAVEMLAAPWARWHVDGSRVRAMLVGGDRLPRPPAHKPPFRLFNNYGPTECTVVATCAEVVEFGSAEAPPIGRPIPSVRAYVLHPDGRPAPVDVVGELYLAGPAVARGYVGDVGEDARCFLPDPHGGESAGAMYRTGDLVTRDADGTLRFVGRADDQIKMNGVRIEPGEVESVLLRHPEVRSAAVVLHRSPDGGEHMVAYVATNGPADVQTLRRYASAQIPKFMTPHHIITVDALPLTAHGKLDRRELANRALPVDTDGDDIAADTPEATLRALWADVLRVPKVDSTDDFFDLGGDSLRVLRFINKARQAGFVLTPEHLYMHPVLADLAQFVEQDQAREEEHDA